MNDSIQSQTGALCLLLEAGLFEYHVYTHSAEEENHPAGHRRRQQEEWDEEYQGQDQKWKLISLSYRQELG